MGHAFTVRLINNASEMKIFCGEESLRKLAGNLAGEQFLRVQPIPDPSSGEAREEYKIFAQSKHATNEAQSPLEAQAADIPHREPIPASGVQPWDREDWRRAGKGGLDWAESYERRKATERKRRVARYAVFLGLFAVVPLSALIALA